MRRFEGEQGFVTDAIYDEGLGCEEPATIVDPLDATRTHTIAPGTSFQDIVKPIFRAGKLVYEIPPIEESRSRTFSNLERFHTGIRRLDNPHQYPVGLERRLHELKTDLILRSRAANVSTGGLEV